jgi:hypothetical protein
VLSQPKIAFTFSLLSHDARCGGATRWFIIIIDFNLNKNRTMGLSRTLVALFVLAHDKSYIDAWTEPSGDGRFYGPHMGMHPRGKMLPPAPPPEKAGSPASKTSTIRWT